MSRGTEELRHHARIGPGPAVKIHVPVGLEQSRIERAPVGGPDVDLDADGSEIGLDDGKRALGCAVRVTAHGEMRGNAVLRARSAVLADPAERVEDLFRLGGIVGRAIVLGDCVVISGDAPRQRSERDSPVAAESRLKNPGAVDGVADRLPEFAVAERGLLVVELHEHQVLGVLVGDDDILGVAIERLHRVGRERGDVEFARLQRRGHHAFLGHDAQGDRFEMGQALIGGVWAKLLEVRVAYENDFGARRPALEHERPGADRMARICRARRLYRRRRIEAEK